jgi:hypothetical protein
MRLKHELFYKEKFMIIQIRPVLRVQNDVFLPSVYDALLVIRPSCNFRDGRVIKNYIVTFRQYFIELPFNDTYLFAVIHLIPCNYSTTLHWLSRSSALSHLVIGGGYDIILGFASVFLFIKSYASCLVGELSQLCYKGVLRAIALGSTDALCTWRCLSLVMLQPVIVPVGRVGLGRIFNVVGSIIDPYLDVVTSCQFNKSIFVVKEPFVESNLLDLTYALQYPNHVIRVIRGESDINLDYINIHWTLGLRSLYFLNSSASLLCQLLK